MDDQKINQANSAEIKLPNLNEPKLKGSNDGLFFGLIQTAIRNTKWSYADFEAVKIVERQLNELHLYFKKIELKKVQETLTNEPVDNSQSTPDQTVDKPEPAKPAQEVEDPAEKKKS